MIFKRRALRNAVPILSVLVDVDVEFMVNSTYFPDDIDNRFTYVEKRKFCESSRL